MIRFDNVTKQYRGGQRPALNAIDLEILRGEFVFLVGASGSGKSSCLRLILKEERPSSGAIHVLGQNLGKISSRKVPHFRRNIGVVFQDFRLLPNKSVFDNVAFSLQVIGKSKGFIQEAVPDTLKMVGLAGKAARLPHELSGGEQQRVAIARAVVNKPAVLLADEPTGNLDPTTSAGIMALLERINAAGTTVVMATHEAGIVDQMKRRVIELSAGSIIRDESQGGYGQTESIAVVHDGVLVVAGDEVVAEEPAPVIIEHEIEPADVPVVDLRVPASEVPAAAVTGSFRARPAQTGLVPTVEVVPDPIGSTVVEIPEEPTPAIPVEPTPAPSPFFGTDAPTVPADGIDVVAAVPADPAPATPESSTPGPVAPEPATPAPAMRGRRGSAAQQQPTAAPHDADDRGPEAPTPSADQVGLQTHTGLIFLPADTGALPEESLAARLGLRPAEDGEGEDRAEGDEQNVGPVK